MKLLTTIKLAIFTKVKWFTIRLSIDKKLHKSKILLRSPCYQQKAYAYSFLFFRLFKVSRSTLTDCSIQLGFESGPNVCFNENDIAGSEEMGSFWGKHKLFGQNCSITKTFMFWPSLQFEFPTWLRGMILFS